MPGLTGLARSLEKQHRLHAFHIWTDGGGEDLNDTGMRQCVMHDGGKLMRKVNTENLTHYLIVAEVTRSRSDAFDSSVEIAADPGSVTSDGVDLFRGQPRVENEETIVLIIGRRFPAKRA
jgi:hypothetical protein